MRPLVSIIIPVYNVERYIKACLESLCEQTYQEIEIIAIDDGSTDLSGDICDKIAKKDSRVSVFHLPNRGVAKARNYGIEIAKGEYFAFADSDDVVAYNFIEQAVLAIKNVDYVSCAFKTVSDKAEECLVDYMLEYGVSVNCTEYLKKMAEYQAGAYWGANWGKLYKTSIINEHNIRFEPNVGFAEDLRFNLEYLKYVDKVALIHNPVYYYRVDTSGSLSKKGRNPEIYWQEYLELYRRYKDLYIMNGIFEDVHIQLAKFLIEAYVSVIRHGISCKNIKFRDIVTLCKKLDNDSEVQTATALYKKMTGRTRLYANMIFHNNGKIIAIILMSTVKLKG